MKRFSNLMYRLIRWLVWLFYPKTQIINPENLPQEPCILVGNHAQMNGPIVSELYIPGRHTTWCISQMMELKEVPAYAFQDFWSQKPKAVRWFYKLLSYVIAPISVCVFNNARTIPVYKDTRVMTTFKRTVNALMEGTSVVIFPEHDVPHNHIVCQFQDKFVDVARPYWKKTGKPLKFVPMYMAPSLKNVYIGQPTAYCPDVPIDQERSRICDYLMDSITEMAQSLPLHTVVPYPNIPKKDYPKNIFQEDAHESTGS